MSSQLRVYPLLTADWSDLDRVGMGPWTCACGAGDAGATSLTDQCPGVPGKRFREANQIMLHTGPWFGDASVSGSSHNFPSGNWVGECSSSALCEATWRHAPALEVGDWLEVSCLWTPRDELADCTRFVQLFSD